MNKAFMTDPVHLRDLEGQRYIVLRPKSEVSKVYHAVQNKIKEKLVGKPVTFPNTEHIVLRGFPDGTDTAGVKTLVQELVGKHTNFDVTINTLTTFPAPFKI